jgi:hypothetical protein
MTKSQRGSAVRPSNVVPGFLAAGPVAGQLPYPMMPAGTQRVIRAALRHAWSIVRARAAKNELPTAPEAQVTTILQFTLNELLDDESEPVPGFSSNHFETVERGAEVVNYDGTRLEKRPDLRFRLQGRTPRVPDRTHYGLFVECKLLDSSHPLRLYASNGILRFVNGDYAWAMPHGLMLAYVRGTTPTRTDLMRLLEDSKAQLNVLNSVLDTPEGEEIVQSLHARTWQYPASTNPPGPIELTHLWLSLS